MINKNNLKNKHVCYIDGDGKFRIGYVVKISGNTLTVKNANGLRKRIHKDKNKILGRQMPKRGLEEIEWKRKDA